MAIHQDSRLRKSDPKAAKPLQLTHITNREVATRSGHKKTIFSHHDTRAWPCEYVLNDQVIPNGDFRLHWSRPYPSRYITDQSCGTFRATYVENSITKSR